MRVLKVVAEGIVTSFRYPFFMQEVQPTFEMPPPATIYGHIASALGEWFDPVGVHFALHFTYKARFEDVEHTHILKSGKGKLPGTRLPKVLEGRVNPFRRELLFAPRLTLYIDRPEWVDAFRHPRYAVALGRSQDLFAYTRVEVIGLEESDHAYLEHTLLPFEFARRTARGITVQMPRFLDYHSHRYPTFSRYVILHRRVHSQDLLRFQGDPPLRFWVDPTAPVIDGDRLGVVFHTWVGEHDQIPAIPLA